jgi:ribose 5-phosphate isomerase A
MSGDAKRRAALAALELIEDGMAVGLGTGSTAALLVDALGQKVAAGLRVDAVATSERTARQAREFGIPLSTLDETPSLDLAIDGADEVDPALDLIKGGGGALLREKIVASCAARFVVIADTSKRVRHLGAFPLPIEVVPMAATPLTRRVAALGAEVALRRDRFGEPFATDEGHWILDCAFGQIADPPALARSLEAMAGVVEHGLFVAMADEVILGGDDGVERLRRG